MKLGVIIPDRGDRPRLLENCLRMLKAQTLQPDIIELVNYAPVSNDRDITARYKKGYNDLRNKQLDLIALIENDDYYAPDYLETMVREWEKQLRPAIIGTNYTIYYHIKLFAYLTMYHMERSSAMSTLLIPDLNFNWCPDNEPYTDMHLWRTLKGVVFKPEKHICLGIKHGTGLCGGRSHVDRLERYTKLDTDHKLLKEVMDPVSLKFYTEYFNQTNNK